MRNEKKDPERCSETVWPAFARGMMSKQCDRAWKVTRGGLVYCKQHDPVAVWERRKASSERYAKEEEFRTRPHKQRREAIELLRLAAECRYIGACQECGPRIKEFLETL
ncbi:MAG TPA: hypothetical protein VMY18_13805 [Acidobacteriota bacterium]|nr:hypothetical protein [Acidobacteriota bacterium]